MAPFSEGDLVETTKGARFWGEVASCYQVASLTQICERCQGAGSANKIVPCGACKGTGMAREWRCDVRAIADDFLGTIHVYPASQLTLRTRLEAVRHAVLGLGNWMAGTIIESGMPSICLGPTPATRQIGAAVTPEDAAHGNKHGAIVISFANGEAAAQFVELVLEAVNKLRDQHGLKCVQ